jgi:tRNA(Ile)-lysidine synthase
VSLSVPGRVSFGPLLIVASEDCVFEDGAVSTEVDAEAVGGSLCVRRRRDGDRFQPLGMKGTKKLQDLFVDAHVPRTERDAIPILENERGIVWVGGLRIADWAQPRPGERTIRLAYRRG